eukprot:5162853-Pleurochrysis_carterae.AAC.2
MRGAALQQREGAGATRLLDAVRFDSRRRCLLKSSFTGGIAMPLMPALRSSAEPAPCRVARRA